MKLRRSVLGLALALALLPVAGAGGSSLGGFVGVARQEVQIRAGVPAHGAATNPKRAGSASSRGRGGQAAPVAEAARGLHAGARRLRSLRAPN